MASGNEYMMTGTGYFPFPYHSKPSDNDTEVTADGLKIIAVFVAIVSASMMVADAEGRHASSDFAMLDTFTDPVLIIGACILAASFIYLLWRASEYFEENKPAPVTNKIEMK